MTAGSVAVATPTTVISPAPAPPLNKNASAFKVAVADLIETERVCTRAAGQTVTAAAAHQQVITDTAAQHIVAGQTVQRVVAPVAIQRIDACGAGCVHRCQRLRRIGACIVRVGKQHVRRGQVVQVIAVEQNFKAVAVGVRLQRLERRLIARQVQHHLERAVIAVAQALEVQRGQVQTVMAVAVEIHDQVALRVAAAGVVAQAVADAGVDKGVGASPADQRIAAAAAQQPVRAAVTGQRVAPCTAHQHVIGQGAQQLVVAGGARDGREKVVGTQGAQVIAVECQLKAIATGISVQTRQVGGVARGVIRRLKGAVMAIAQTGQPEQSEVETVSGVVEISDTVTVGGGCRAIAVGHGGETEHIAARAAAEPVGPCSAVNHVVACAAIDAVTACAAADQFIRAAANQRVGGGTAAHDQHIAVVVHLTFAAGRTDVAGGRAVDHVAKDHAAFHACDFRRNLGHAPRRTVTAGDQVVVHEVLRTGFAAQGADRHFRDVAALRVGMDDVIGDLDMGRALQVDPRAAVVVDIEAVNAAVLDTAHVHAIPAIAVYVAADNGEKAGVHAALFMNIDTVASVAGHQVKADNAPPSTKPSEPLSVAVLLRTTSPVAAPLKSKPLPLKWVAVTPDRLLTAASRTVLPATTPKRAVVEAPGPSPSVSTLFAAPSPVRVTLLFNDSALPEPSASDTRQRRPWRHSRAGTRKPGRELIGRQECSDRPCAQRSQTPSLPLPNRLLTRKAALILRPICGAVALLLSLNCAAELRVKSPVQICRLLADTQLRAGDWRQDDTGSQGCSSGTRPVSADVPAGSQIGYAAEGADDIPTRVTLTLGGISKADDDLAKRELVTGAPILECQIRPLILIRRVVAFLEFLDAVPRAIQFHTGLFGCVGKTAHGAKGGEHQMREVFFCEHDQVLWQKCAAGGVLINARETAFPGASATCESQNIAAAQRSSEDSVVSLADLTHDDAQLRYRLAVKATNDAIWDWDLRADHVLWNDALERVYGHSLATIGKTGEWWLAQIHP
nr:hypothetical protein [Tanacetum cinerariifolium]